MKKCSRCNIVKDEIEFYKDRARYDGLQSCCKDCSTEMNKTYRENNRENFNKRVREHYYKHGSKPMSENKECAQYLGCHITERILKHVMPNAVLMDNNNPGFDLVCGKGFLVDAKSSTLRYEKNKRPYWQFHIRYNKTPDYFMLVAYKDRESLEICHMWLVPGDVINDKVNVSIYLSNIHKWDEYKISHTDALSCAMQLNASA